MRVALPHRSLALLVTLLALAAIALGALSPRADADAGEAIVERCTHGQSLRGFSQQAYREALKDLSAGTEEYSNCASLIRQAQLAAAGHPGGEGASGAGAPAAAPKPTPAEQRAIAQAPKAGAAPLAVGNQTIHPGVVHANIASAFSTMPTALAATVAFLLVGLLLVGANAIRARMRSRRGR